MGEEKRVLVKLTKDQINPCIVMLTSFCENNTGHSNIIIEGDDIDQSCIDRLGEALGEYDVIIIKSKNEDAIGDIPELPVDVIIDGDISKVLNGEEDGILIAPDAHDAGMACKDVRGKYPVIAYPDDKPWLSTNIHYDLESIWWEYAKKTCVFHELMETFLESSLSNTFLEEYAIKLCDENDQIRETINQTRETIGKLLG
jgi:hypothetical protein